MTIDKNSKRLTPGLRVKGHIGNNPFTGIVESVNDLLNRAVVKIDGIAGGDVEGDQRANVEAYTLEIVG
jgi:hypothetical protein